MKKKKTNIETLFWQNSGCRAIFSNDFGLKSVFLAYILIGSNFRKKIMFYDFSVVNFPKKVIPALFV